MGVSRAARLSRTRTRALGLLSAATVGSFLLVIVPATAQADAGLIAATNAARSSAGVPAVAESADLDAAAAAHAQSMARSGILAHTPSLGSGVCCWSKIGENVGEGPSVGALHAAFMASTEHRNNILDRAYNQMGVGYATDAHGTLWVSELFRQSTGTAPAAPVVTAPVVHPTTHPTVHVTPRPTHAAVPTPAPAAKVVAAAPAPAVAAAPVVPAGPASRDLSRLPLDVAQRFAAQLAGGDDLASSNPVSRLLDFAAKASQAQS
jgi:hypothetical protein